MVVGQPIPGKFHCSTLLSFSMPRFLSKLYPMEELLEEWRTFHCDAHSCAHAQDFRSS